jgi:BASS family bile acid:Na+ symporter
LIKLTQAADGDLAIASGLLVLLVVVSIGYMPIVVPLIAPDAQVSAISIATPLILTMLLPLGIGLFVDAKFESWADRLQPLMNKASSAALVVLLVTTVLTNGKRLLDVLGTGAILAALLFIAGAFIVGYLLGMTGRGTREELGLATAQRNIAAATVVATQSFNDSDTLVMVVITSIVTMVILFPVARALRKRVEAQAKTHGRRVTAHHKEPLV